MRLLRILVAVLFVAFGAAVGALNPQRVSLDLGFAGLDAGLGVLVLGALLAGAVLGGLILVLGVVVPLRGALARRRQAHVPPSFPDLPGA